VGDIVITSPAWVNHRNAAEKPAPSVNVVIAI
jgi:hypothetical protein